MRPDGKQPIVSVRDLHVGFGAKMVLKGLDLDVMPGEVTGFVGGSGQGKSVLTRTILGLVRKNPAASKCSARTSTPCRRASIGSSSGAGA